MTRNESTASRRLRFEIFRYNPEDSDSKPHMQTFELDEAPYMSLYIALNQIRETQDPSLQFDFACRSAICGSCGMMVNGRPALGCRTLTTDLPDGHPPASAARVQTDRRPVRRHRHLVPADGREVRGMDACGTGVRSGRKRRAHG